VANNVVSSTVGLANTGTNNNATIKVSLDRYGSETSWKILKSNGTVAYQSPTYADAAANGTYPQPDINTFLADDCYKLEVLDSYGDGYDSGYGNGLVEVYVNGTMLAGVSNFPSGSEAMDAFSLDAVAGVNEMLNTTLRVFPNPANDVLHVAFDANNADYSINISDLQGRNIQHADYSALSGSQDIALNVSDLSAGTYVIQITSNGVTTTKNVVIK